MKCLICNNDYKFLRRHLYNTHNIDGMDYWINYIGFKIPTCKLCGNKIYTFRNNSIIDGPSDYCCIDCKNKAQSELLKKLHKDGIYKGTSHFIKYNKTEAHKIIASNTSYKYIRYRSMNLLKKFGDRLLTLYLGTNGINLKLGVTGNLIRRSNDLNIDILATYTGNLELISRLEYDLLNKYSNYLINGSEWLPLELKTELINEFNQLANH